MKKKFHIVFVLSVSVFFMFSTVIFAAVSSSLKGSEKNEQSDSLRDYLSDTETLMKNFDYVIGPEDELEVYVWRNLDLSRTIIVRPDGKITLPVIDEIEAAGLTVEELDRFITEKYSKFIKEPQVSIFLKGFRSKRVTILGEVRQPGVYPIVGRLSVLEAISEAKYDKERANLKSVMVIREEKGAPLAKRLNLTMAIKGKQLDQNIILQPGDIVFVPSSFIAEVNTFVDLFFGKTKPAIDFYLGGYKAIYSPTNSQ